MKLAVEFDNGFYNEQTIYNLLVNIQKDNKSYNFVLCQKKKCENTKAFHNMCLQFNIDVEYQDYPESCTQGVAYLSNNNYEIILD